MSKNVNKLKCMAMHSIILCSGVMVAGVYAAPYVPATPDYIIAQWASPNTEALRNLQVQSRLQPNDAKTIVALANQYLLQAAHPGQSRLYGVAEATLKPLLEKTPNDVTVLLPWAQIQQHQHKFTIALAVLEKILVQQPDNIAANLLAARVHLVQGNAQTAQAFCLRLLGHADLLTLSACSLEVRSTLGDKELTDSYAQLQQVLVSQGLPSDERQGWVLQILADMALRLAQPQAALDFLDQIPTKFSTKKSLSVWVQWSDVQLALGNQQLVISELTALLKASTQPDDSLLVRLALAEKNIAQTNAWQVLLSERIALREQRDDQAHAADVAIYYLDIAPDADKALHWAELNWQQARESSDKKLLTRAQQASALINKEDK